MKLEKYSLSQLAQVHPVLSYQEEINLTGGAKRITDDLALLSYSEMMSVYGTLENFPADVYNTTASGAENPSVMDMMDILRESAFFDHSIYSIIESGTIDWGALYSNEHAVEDIDNYLADKSFVVAYSTAIEIDGIPWTDERPSTLLKNFSNSIGAEIADRASLNDNQQSYVKSHLYSTLSDYMTNNGNYLYETAYVEYNSVNEHGCEISFIDSRTSEILLVFTLSY